MCYEIQRRRSTGPAMVFFRSSWSVTRFSLNPLSVWGWGTKTATATASTATTAATTTTGGGFHAQIFRIEIERPEEVIVPEETVPHVLQVFGGEKDRPRGGGGRGGRDARHRDAFFLSYILSS